LNFNQSDDPGAPGICTASNPKKSEFLKFFSLAAAYFAPRQKRAPAHEKIKNF